MTLPTPLDHDDALAVIGDLRMALTHLEAAGTKLEARHGKGADAPEAVLDLFDRLGALLGDVR